jgi:WD40 repeat protein
MLTVFQSCCIQSGLLLSTTISHTDFLKSLLVLPHLPTPLLLSGSSDKQLHIHSLASILFPQPFPTQPTASTPASTSSSSTPSTSTNPSVPPQAAKPQPIPRATERSPLPRSHPPIKTHTRPINCLASGLQTERDVVTVYSADSLGRTIVWEVKVERGEGEVKIKEIGRLKEHKTSVMDLSVGEEGVWTCASILFVYLYFTLVEAETASSILLSCFSSSGSADASAMYHPLLPPPTTTSASAKAVSLPTPKRKPPPQIHSLLLLPHLQPPLLLTGSADEHIRVYDLSLGEGPQQARLLREVEGHCAEVVALRRWVRRDVEGREGRGEEWVVSAGLDGTVRRWRVGEIVLPAPVVDEEEEKKGELEEGMTEEEARELAELMGDED